MTARRFELHRDRDITGTSGVGVVAEGVEFSDGTTVVRWRGDTPSTVMWPPMCSWAPVDHEALATYWLTFAWPCGHEQRPITASCADHTARARATPVAGRATSCPTCSLTGPLTLTSARSVRL